MTSTSARPGGTPPGGSTSNRTKALVIGGIAVALIALIAAVAVILTRSGSDDTADPPAVTASSGVAYTGADVDTITLANVTAPSAATASGGIPVGVGGTAGVPAPEGDVVVSVYLDYWCRYCRMFEIANDAELAELRAAGGVTVEYHLLSFLDDRSDGNEFSTRAANAAAVVADGAPEQFSAFHLALFETEPASQDTWFTDDEIAQIAREAGVPADVIDRFTAGAPDGDWRTFAEWVAANTNQAAIDLGGISTPTVLIDGEHFEGDMYTPGPLTDAIRAAMR